MKAGGAPGAADAVGASDAAGVAGGAQPHEGLAEVRTEVHADVHSEAPTEALDEAFLAGATAGLTVGIDLGGTQLRAALLDAQGRLLRRRATLTDVAGGPRAVVRQMAALVAQVTQGVARAAIQGVGVSSPGPLDGASGVVFGIPTLPGWVDIPLVAWLHEALGLPVVLENDAVSAAIGEWHFGAGRGLDDFVYVTISTGIGGGVIAGGRVLHGRRRLAAHFGHMTTHPDGEVCGCGARGCWEAQASGSSLGRAARAAAAAAPDSALHRLGDTLDARQLFEAARAGDALALQLVEREAQLLGVGIVNLLHLFSPAAVVLGGGVSQGFDLLGPGIARQVQARAMPPFRDVPVVTAQLGPNAGLVGAACLVMAPQGPGSAVGATPTAGSAGSTPRAGSTGPTSSAAPAAA